MITKELASGLSFSSSTPRDEAIDVLARRCGPRACSIARSLVGDAAQAEELVQEALVRTYERFDQLRDTAALDAWFYRILTRLCLNSLRKRSRWQRFVARWRPTEPIANAPCGDLDRLRSAVAELPDRQRLAVVLRYGNDFSLSEVAAALDVAPATAKTHLIRALKRLRDLLGVSDD